MEALHSLIRKQFNFTQFALERKRSEVMKPPDKFQGLHTQQTMGRMRKQTVKSSSLEAQIVEKMRDPLLYQESKQDLYHIDISTLMYNFLYLKSGGHPLILINLISNLMERNFIWVDEDNDTAFISDQFKAIIEHEEWLRVEVPLSSL